jgi:hypothetical protein
MEGNVTQETVQICRSLRTKMYYVLGRFHNDVGESSPTAQYWCLRTMQTFGPDGHYVCPEDCQTGRCCYDGCQ